MQHKLKGLDINATSTRASLSLCSQHKTTHTRHASRREGHSCAKPSVGAAPLEMYALVLWLSVPVGFVPPSRGCLPATAPRVSVRLSLADEASLAVSLAAFSATHVGLSNVRDPIIKGCGEFADRLGVVGTGAELPSVWLGDASGNALFPDADTTGRQLFRILYSMVAFATLFGALGAYVACRQASMPLPVEAPARAGLFAVATVAQGCSVASLLNPSPLSLVPGFRSDAAAPFGLARDDSLKLSPYGLTRITRHPLILPVVPWGLSNAVLVGGRSCDLLFFGGLALYALVGCKAQDERAAAAAEVGTVFARGDLSVFYETTSFVPFMALVDGRQRFADVLAEVQWAYLAAGVALGGLLEAATLGAVEALS
jgi:uncharacterized membrane protein